MSCKKLRQSLEVISRIAGTYLDQTGVQEDAAAERVQNAADDARRRAVRVVRLAHAQAGRDPDGGRDAVEDRADDGDVVVLRRQPDERQPRANTEALERPCSCMRVSDGMNISSLEVYEVLQHI